MEFRHGALSVVQWAKPPSEIDRRLKEIDPNLFLEKQVVFDGSEVWCVCYHVGSEHPPITFFEWRDELDNPISELTDQVVERVQRMDRDPAALSARVLQRNERMIEAKRREREEIYEQLGQEAYERMHRTTFLMGLPNRRRRTLFGGRS